MKKKSGILFSLFVIIFSISVLAEDEIPARSSITSVTVYPDRAMVMRTADVSLEAGPHAVVFEGLPAALIPNSLRLTGRGTAGLKILGMESERQFLEASLLPEVSALEAEIENLTFEITKTKDKMDVLEAQERLLLSIQFSRGSTASPETPALRPDIQTLEKILDFLGTKLLEVRAARLSQQKILKDQDAKLKALQKKLDSIKPGQGTEARKVTALVEALQAGKFSLSLSYTVKNARWAPMYTMRAVPDTGEIELSVMSHIQQKTGENWDNVSTFLSTASPAMGTSPPVLPPWYLNILVPRTVLAEETAVVGAVAMKAEAPEKDLMATEAEVDKAAMIESGLHLSFEIKRPVEILSDGTPHKVPIDQQNLKAKFNYLSVPKRREAAFLKGEVQNSLPYPLLAGSSDLFILQDFVGTARISYVAPGEEAKIFFGEDNQVSVKYEQVQREKSPPSFLGKTEKLRLVYKITLQNFRNNPIEIEVLDQLPVSQNSKIEVKEVKLNPAPDKRDDKGILTWNVPMASKEKKEILIEFVIEYPKDARITGI